MNRTAARGLQWSLSLVVLWGTYQLAFGAPSIGAARHIGLADLLRFLLAASEAVAAILFLVPATMTAGGVGLLVIFVIAAGIDGLHGQFSSIGPLVVALMAVLAILSQERPKPPESPSGGE